MKFVCDRCQTKYSIADEKVRGKILKVRCKTCSNVITVREASAAKPSSPSLSPVRDVSAVRPSAPSLAPVRPAAAPAPARASSASRSAVRAGGAAPARDDDDDPIEEQPERTVIAPNPTALMFETPAPRRQPTRPLVPGGDSDGVQWFLALDGKQHGPFPRKTLVDRLMGLAKDADVHVWNEGLDGWKEPRDVPEVAREIAARRRAAPPPPPRPPQMRVTPPAPLPTTGARGRTQPLASLPGAPVPPSGPVPGPLGPGAPRLPRPSVRAMALSVPSPHGDASEDIDTGSLLETPPPMAPVRGKGANGVGARAGSGAAALPSAPLAGGESDALNALNLRAATGAAPRVVSASELTGWGEAVAPAHEAARSRHRNAKLVFAFLGVVALVCLVLLFNVFKRPPPAAAPAPPKMAAGDDTFASLADKVATEKPAAPTVAPPPPTPPVEPPRKGPPAKGRPTARAGSRGAPGRGSAPPSVSPPPAEDPSAARFREGPGRAVQPVNSTPQRIVPGQDAITRVINNNKNGIKTCYQRALLRDSSLVKGKLVVRVSIGLSGKVKGVAVDGPTHFKALEPCINDVVRRWLFPPSSEEYGTEFVSSFQGSE